MTQKEWLKTIPDESLIGVTKTALVDCEEAAKKDYGSEWHEACFAALFIFSQEMARRKLKLKVV